MKKAWPFKTEQEAGLFFMAFTRSLKEIDRALDRMLGINTNDEKQVDNLLSITKAVSTNYYYCPSLPQLADLSSE